MTEAHVGSVHERERERESSKLLQPRLITCLLFTVSMCLLPTRPPCLLHIGCFKMRLSFYSGMNLVSYCVQAPTDAAIATGNWDSLPLRLTHETCNNAEPRQCFRIDDSLASGTRITYQGLCIGLKSTPLPSSPGTFTDSVRLMPCNKGYTEWRQKTASNWMLINHPNCLGTPTPQLRECFLGWVFPVTGNIARRDMQIMDMREGGTVISSKHRTDGRSYYTVSEQSPGGCRCLNIWSSSLA